MYRSVHCVTLDGAQLYIIWSDHLFHYLWLLYCTCHAKIGPLQITVLPKLILGGDQFWQIIMQKLIAQITFTAKIGLAGPILVAKTGASLPNFVLL